VRLKNVSTQYCLDTDGSKVYTLDCNEGANQQWTMIQRDIGISFQNVATKKCLDTDGRRFDSDTRLSDNDARRRVYLNDCNDGSYQQWKSASA
jgi:serine/threonine-protein kinase